MNVELDIGPLSWVKGEIDLALERAGESLATHGADATGDGLAKARASMHQAHGALAIVGLEGITEFANAIEQLLSAIGDGSAKDVAGAIAAAQGGFSALRAYLDDLMAGHPDQPLKLMPAYAAMAVARGAPAPVASALFFPDLTQRPPKREKEPTPLAADALAARLKAARLGFERGLLKWLKGDAKGAAEMKVSTAMIEMTRVTPAARAYWWIGIGVLDAMVAGGIAEAGEAKRFAMKLGALIKKLTEGQADVPEPALREALYLAASATKGGEALAVVKAAYRLEGMVPTATPSETERLMPHIRRLRELLSAAKDEWNRLCAGTAAALPPFHENTAKIAEEGAATGRTDYKALTAAILECADRLRRDPSRHTETLAIEMATALLLAESALENFQSLSDDFTQSTRAVTDRLAALERGEELEALELPHLDAMSRRAQERLLLESVAREIKGNLGAIETALDAFFRDSSKQSGLPALQAPIRQIQGALLVLGQDRANAVLAECAAAIDRFAQPGFAAQPGEFEDVAKKLSALGFFVSQLQGGAADIDAILAPPPPKPKEEAPEPPLPVAAPEPTPPAVVEPAVAEAPQAVPMPAMEAAPPAGVETATEISAAMPESALELAPAASAEELPLEEFEVEVPLPLEPEPAPAPAPAAVEVPAPSAEAERLIDASEEELDAELLGIFLEEANEVLATIKQNLPTLHSAPSDHEALVTVRRSFHTLKGSGRMVGLAELGEAAWGVEQTLNAWLQESKPVGADLLAMLDLSADLFSDWVRQLEGGGSRHHDYDDLDRRCQVLRGVEPEAPVAEPAVAEAPAPVEVPTTIEVPLASEAPATVETPVAEEAPAAAVPAIEELPPVEALVIPEPSVETPSPAELPELELELPEDTGAAAPTSPPPEPTAVKEPAPAAPAEPVSAEVVNFPSPPPIRIGSIEVAPTLYNLYLEETRGHVATLLSNLGLESVPGNDSIRAAHTTASISAATGIMPLSTLARALEDALGRLALIGAAPTEAQRYVLARCAGALEGMLGAVAERRMPGEEQELTEELRAMQPAVEPVVAPVPEQPTAPPEAPSLPEAEAPAEAPATPAEEAQPALPEVSLTAADRRAARMEDEIDFQILPLFLEESVDLMRDIGEALRNWRTDPANAETAKSLQRYLHTLKGSARMAGAMGCGELLHSMEDRIDQAVRMKAVTPAMLDGLETSYDRAEMLIDRLRNPSAATSEKSEEKAELAPASVTIEREAEPAAPTVAAAAEATEDIGAKTAAPSHYVPTQVAHLRVRADLVDQLVNEAGEVAIARGRIEGELLALKTSMLDLTENIIRLRKQLREVEIQAESQMQSQQAIATEHAVAFDPLEFDRFTRFQEVTRMMAESVNDVATVQQNLMRNLDHANAAVAAQARLSRELQQRLMGVRMVPFESIADRLHRVVRQAAKDTAKRANLDIRHGQTEIDRSVLEKMAGPLEHMLRNSVAHGLESPAGRSAAGKGPIGQITISLAQEGNEIVVSISDDGAGLNLEKIRSRAVDRGLLAYDATPDEQTLMQMIMQSGFSTADEVTTLAGRGVGMDVVRSETASLGGRIEITSAFGKGATFRVYLPLTLAVTQVVLVTFGNRYYAIPASMIEQATEQKSAAAEDIRKAGNYEWLGTAYPYHYLGRLLGNAGATPPQERRHWMLLIRGGTERVALEVDSLSGNMEVVVKAVGPQLARIPGLAGATVLANGDIALILNPVALAARAAERAATPAVAAPAPVVMAEIAPTIPAAVAEPPSGPSAAPAVMVVDDSLTVRKISGRLLARHGYHVLTAKDGVDALEQLADVIPDVMLLDIEMPRMDGFDLARNIRGDKRLKHIPLIMITSRTADKHRQLATEIGVDHYLGKPYDEDELLGYIRECIANKPR